MLYRDDNVRYGRPLTLTLSLAALVVIIAGIRAGADLLIPLLLGLFIAVICTSPVNWLRRLGITPPIAVLITLLVIGGFLLLVGLLAVNAFGTFIEALPGIEDQLYYQYLNLLDSLAAMGLAINPDTLAGLVEGGEESGWLSALLGGIGNLLMQSMVVALLVIFMLFETLNFRRKVAQALDDPEASLRRFQEFSLTLKRYLAVKTFVSLLTGILAWLACVLAGVDFPCCGACWPSPSTTFPTSVRPSQPCRRSCCCWLPRAAGWCRLSAWPWPTWRSTSCLATWWSRG